MFMLNCSSYSFRFVEYLSYYLLILSCFFYLSSDYGPDSRVTFISVQSNIGLTIQSGNGKNYGPVVLVKYEQFVFGDVLDF